MATINPRLNITLDPETTAMLRLLAEREKRSLSSIAKDLILDALDRHEDMALSVLAEKMEKQSTGRVSHEDAWK